MMVALTTCACRVLCSVEVVQIDSPKQMRTLVGTAFLRFLEQY